MSPEIRAEYAGTTDEELGATARSSGAPEAGEVVRELGLRAVDCALFANRRWVERLRHEALHLLDLGAHVGRAGSVAEVARAYQIWFGQRLTIAALDAQTFSAVPAKLLTARTHALARARAPRRTTTVANDRTN